MAFFICYFNKRSMDCFSFDQEQYPECSPMNSAFSFLICDSEMSGLFLYNLALSLRFRSRSHFEGIDKLVSPWCCYSH